MRRKLLLLVASAGILLSSLSALDAAPGSFCVLLQGTSCSVPMERRECVDGYCRCMIPVGQQTGFWSCTYR